MAGFNREREFVVGMEAGEPTIIKKSADLFESRIASKEGISFALQTIPLEFGKPLLVDT